MTKEKREALRLWLLVLAWTGCIIVALILDRVGTAAFAGWGLGMNMQRLQPHIERFVASPR